MKHLIYTLMLLFTSTGVCAQETRQMEKLDRAPVALPSSSGRGIFLSWRFLGTDHLNTKFDVIRNGTVIKSDLSVTNFSDII